MWISSFLISGNVRELNFKKIGIKEIRIIILQGKPLSEKVNQLIEEANEAGGSDNITVLLIKVEEEVELDD